MNKYERQCCGLATGCSSRSPILMVIQRQANLIVLLNHGAFQAIYVREAKACRKKTKPAKSRRSAETMAWKGGNRLAIGTREYLASSKVDQAGRPRQLITLYAVRRQRPQISTNRHRDRYSVSAAMALEE